CWITYEEENVINTVTLTRVILDNDTDSTQLEVMGIWSRGQTMVETLESWYVSLRSYAKSRGCTRLVCYGGGQSLDALSKIANTEVSQVLIVEV
ncbi:unnamed protein product, partial [marine sediment metagenome]